MRMPLSGQGREYTRGLSCSPYRQCFWLGTPQSYRQLRAATAGWEALQYVSGSGALDDVSLDGC